MFDKIVSYACFARNVFLAKNMNLDVGKKQLRLKDEFNDKIEKTQLMIFSDNYLRNLL